MQRSSAERHANRLKCLVADDIDQNRLLVRKLVERLGIEVIEAVDGRDALKKFEENSVDIVLLDIMMPEMDGLAVCRELRKRCSLSELPILFLTARLEERDLAEGFEAGANDYLTKPVSAVVLSARLNAQIRALSASRALLAAEQQLARRRRMETIGLFAAGIAHNFNNLLGTILGSAELLKETTPGTAAAADLIIGSARKGAELTESLLTFAQPKSQEICSDPVQIAKAAIPLIRASTGNRIDYQVLAAENLPAIAISSSDLSAILLELLNNAVEAVRGDGDVTISITTEGSFVDFVVSDTGSGIPESLAERIFDPFSSTKNPDPSVNFSLDGSGLGLSTVYNLVEHASGAVNIEQTGPQGTTIKVRLPQAAGAEKPNAD